MQLLTVTGNLAKDAEKKDVNGNALYSFSIAANKKVKGEETTTWYNIECWGDFWKGVAQYLSKGTKVLVVGELNIRSYKKKDGTEGASYDVRADKVELIGGKREEDTSFNHGANEKPAGAKKNPFDEG